MRSGTEGLVSKESRTGKIFVKTGLMGSCLLIRIDLILWGCFNAGVLN